MKKFLLFIVILISVVFIINSCQKQQDNTGNQKSTELSSSKKTETISGETITGLPDLVIDADRLLSSIIIRNKVIKASDCAFAESCVDGTGKRKLLRFDVAIANKGNADLFLGNPSGNELFELSSCHKHYHLSGFANYELLNNSSSNVLTGHKQAFCLLDYSRVDPAAGPGKYTCSNQGISVGWQDVYGSHLDCQWLDITGITPGNYLLRVSINPEGKLTESDYNNNIATVPVKITK